MSGVLDKYMMHIVDDSTGSVGAGNWSGARAHGLDGSKILLCKVYIDSAGSGWFNESYRPTGTSYSFHYYLADNGVDISFVDVEPNLQSKAFRAFLIYTS